ncbi:hypothetical protein ACIQGZ_02545 [Streptomyces sp. NPDC092296]|uniref:hypothetical protein n=1 Tax=Streptomyces sp. NPDC092296 TaxID=3366012 RepID=UPI00382278E1
MADLPFALAALAASPPPPQATERSPLLYAWWALQAITLALLGYAVVRYLRKRRATGRTELPTGDHQCFAGDSTD